MIEKVTYVTLFVSDQEKALDFYTNTLGFEKRGDNATPEGPRFLTVGLRGQELQIVLWPGTHGSPKLARGNIPGACIFESSDCRKDFEVLKSRGVKFEEPGLVEQPYGMYATLADPDGNRLMIRQPPNAR